MDLVVDHQQNVLITGAFADTVDFDPGPGTFELSGISSDIFVLKLSPQGNLIWAIANVEASPSVTGNGVGANIQVDQNDNVYLTGDMGGEVDFDPGPGQTVLVSTSNFWLVVFIL